VRPAPRTVFIAGASRGIGAACARAFLDAGLNVVAASRSIELAERERYLSIRADFTDPSEVGTAVERARGRFGAIGAVVHCVGDIQEARPLSDISWERWRATLDQCLGSAVHLVRATMNDVQSAAGSYVFVSSVAARKPYPGIADYCAAKSALGSFVRSLASELAPSGARANTISPAVIDTDLFRRSPYSEAEASAWHALRRIGTPEEVASLAVFLVTSEAGAWMTGQDHVIDGGMLL
jgi:3-oxoacyl-[acyl-carrier protein] reductase